MIALYSPTQRQHDPQFFLSSGALHPCPEKPSRIDSLLQGLHKLGVQPQEPQDPQEPKRPQSRKSRTSSKSRKSPKSPVSRKARAPRAARAVGRAHWSQEP